MKLIRRWSLMQSASPENIMEHSQRVALLAHALGTVGNVKFGKHWDPERAAFLALLHDAGEVITGDMPTPVKYYNAVVRDAYAELEKSAAERLLSFLPEEFRSAYAPALLPEETDADSWLLVRAADKLCAWLKCVEERRGGNREFLLAEKSLREQLDGMKMPEVEYFIEQFGPGFAMTLDELGAQG
jgi:5'-deoxynucleotidase